MTVIARTHRTADTTNGEAIAPFGLTTATAAEHGRSPINPARLRRAKAAYTTRFLAERIETDATGFSLVSGADVTPRAGDVVLARVVSLGKHTRIESPVSRRRHLFIGDEVLVAYGHRYAPDQFEAEVPQNLRTTSLIAAGGLAGDVTASHGAVGSATTLEPVGLLADVNGTVNLTDLAPYRSEPATTLGAAAGNGTGSTSQVSTSPVSSSPVSSSAGRTGNPPVIVVFGTSMNSGKSTTVACLARGLAGTGAFVAAGKATGTGAGNDRHMFTDAGAARVLDFTDFGHGSTFRISAEQLRGVVGSVIGELRDDPRADVVVIEIADGIFQTETRALLHDPEFAELIDAVVFAAGDAAGASAGARAVVEAGLPLAAVSGLVTASPLAAREAAALIDVPVISTYDLADPSVAAELLATTAARPGNDALL